MEKVPLHRETPTDHHKRLTLDVPVHRDGTELVHNEFVSIGTTPRKDQSESPRREARQVSTAALGTGLDRLEMKFSMMTEAKALVVYIVTSDRPSTAMDQFSTECHRPRRIQFAELEIQDLEKAVEFRLHESTE